MCVCLYTNKYVYMYICVYIGNLYTNKPMQSMYKYTLHKQILIYIYIAISKYCVCMSWS